MPLETDARPAHISKAMTMVPLFPVLLPVPETVRQFVGREQVRALSRHGRRAVALSAKARGVVLGELEKDESGAPLPSNGWFWSLSHKKEIAAGVVAPQPVGIDVEIRRPVSAALCRRIADSEEWSLVGKRDSEKAFFRFWTAKEAVLKAAGIGMKALSRCRILALEGPQTCVDFNSEVWRVVHLFQGDYVAAVTDPGAGVVWQIQPPDAL